MGSKAWGNRDHYGMHVRNIFCLSFCELQTLVGRLPEIQAERKTKEQRDLGSRWERNTVCVVSFNVRNHYPITVTVSWNDKPVFLS